jgi:hypothetical protein
LRKSKKKNYIPAHRTQHDNDEEEEIKRVEEDYTRQSARPEFGLEEALEELSRHEDPQEEQLQVLFTVIFCISVFSSDLIFFGIFANCAKLAIPRKSLKIKKRANFK